MKMTVHERPGVYSSYNSSTVVNGGGGRKAVGLVGVCAGVEAVGKVQTVTSFEEASALFGSGELTELIRIILRNGAGSVAALAIENEDGYTAGFETLEKLENLPVIVCGSTKAEVHTALRTSVESASALRRERIAVVGGGRNGAVAALAARAKALNSERMVLAAPGAVDDKGTALDGMRLAAAIAGAIAAESDPALPLSGAALFGLYGVSANYNDNEIDLLIQGGVTPVESVGGEISVVRGVTTRTKTGQEEDLTWRDLSTILIVDDVIPAVRGALRSRFQRSKNTEQSRGAIRSQVVLTLENKLSREIITGYDSVRVSVDPERPSVCLVDFSFTVAHGLNQIWLTAHITI